MEEIAQQAGVGKATIYKWWPGKAYVALEAFLERFRHEVKTRDTGSAKEDFRLQLNESIGFYSGPMGKVFRDFVAECQHEATFAEVYRAKFLEPRRESVRIIWERGVQRGEIDGAFGCELVIDLVYAPLVYRLLIGHQPFTKADASRLLEGVFEGIRPATAKRTRGTE